METTTIVVTTTIRNRATATTVVVIIQTNTFQRDMYTCDSPIVAIAVAIVAIVATIASRLPFHQDTRLRASPGNLKKRLKPENCQQLETVSTPIGLELDTHTITK